MKSPSITFFGAVMVVVGVIVPAKAQQQPCGPRTGVLKHLDKTHQEAPQALGITGSGQVIELLVSDKGTWTIIVTDPSGMSCLVAAGEDWEMIEKLASGKPAA